MRLGWSATNVLVLYWLESLMVAIFICLRIDLHRRLTRRRGHWREGQLASSPGGLATHPVLLGNYAVIAFVFTLAHGLFVLTLTWIISARHPDDPAWRFAFDPLVHGALAMFAPMLIDFCVDPGGIRARPFAWIRACTQQRMGRVLILHLAIILGMFASAAFESPYGLLYALILLNTLWDLMMSGADARAAPPLHEPPAWLSKLGARIGKGQGGSAELARQWTQNLATAARNAAEDEQVVER